MRDGEGVKTSIKKITHYLYSDNPDTPKLTPKSNTSKKQQKLFMENAVGWTLCTVRSEGYRGACQIVFGHEEGLGNFILFTFFVKEGETNEQRKMRLNSIKLLKSNLQECHE